MSKIKERILGAVTVMSDDDAKVVWELILNRFSGWEGIEEVSPDEIDIQMLREIENDPECKEFVSGRETMEQIGL